MLSICVQVVDDWGYVAVVIDRLQLYIFLVVTVVGSAVLLTNAPHIFEFVDQDEIKRKLTSQNWVYNYYSLTDPVIV